MARRKMLYEGKAKIIYEGTEPGTVIPVSYTHLTLPTTPYV